MSQEAWEPVLASLRPDWLLLVLGLVSQGGVAKSAGVYFDRGCPVAQHLIPVFDRLVWAGWIGVAPGDPIWAMRVLSLTGTGQARYAASRQGQARERDVECAEGVSAR